MRAKIHPIGQFRMALPEGGERLVATGEEALLLPDFIEAARVAAVAREDILGAQPEPAGDPNVDGILLRQGSPLAERRASL